MVRFTVIATALLVAGGCSFDDGGLENDDGGGHGELSLEQLAFLRPLAGWARYRTPLQDLWMCASGTHPGGGIMGAPGALCAREIVQGGKP